MAGDGFWNAAPLVKVREAEPMVQGGLSSAGAGVGRTSGKGAVNAVLTTDGSDKLSEEQARDLVAQLEPDRDGLVNYREYVNMMMSDS